MEPAYLIRYGTAGLVGRFVADPGARYDRGQAVVVRSHRGTEIGEVLIPAPAALPADGGTARVLRPAAAGDLERARSAERERPGYFDDCLRVFGSGAWPVDLLDVEPLLDDKRIVLHYLGPHKLDVAGLLAVFRETYQYDVMFQPVGRDEAEAIVEADHSHEGGGCGSASGCGSCAVKGLVAARR